MILRYITIFLILIVCVGAIYLWRSGFLTSRPSPIRSSFLRSLTLPDTSISSRSGSPNETSGAGSEGAATTREILEAPKDPGVSTLSPDTREDLTREIESRFGAGIKKQKEIVSGVSGIPPILREETIAAPRSSGIQSGFYTSELATYRDLMIAEGIIATTSFQTLNTSKDAELFLGKIFDYKVKKNEITKEEASSAKAMLKDAYAAIGDGTYFLRFR